MDIVRVDFFSHIDWQEKYKTFQVSFPVNIVSPQASYEIAYAVCKRGAALLNKNKKQSRLRLFMLRLCEHGRRHPESDRGIKVLQTSALPLGYGAIPLTDKIIL